MTKPRIQCDGPASASGHTLVELVAALAITGVLVLGVASAMLVASKAVDPASPLRNTQAAAEATARIAEELRFATGFTQRAARAVTFTVADRDGDGSEETIGYSWSNTAGDPLMRQYNGGTAVPVLSDVHHVYLRYITTSLTEQPDAVRNESGEILLASHMTATNSGDYAIKEKDWLAQYFKPTLPANAVSWAVTRVLFKARTHGAAYGVAGVELRLPTASNVPSDVILQQINMYEDHLTYGYLWQEFAFSNVSGLSPSRGLCLVISCIKRDSDLCDIEFDKEDNPGGYIKGKEAGAIWEPDSDRCLLYAVYGTVTTANTPDPVTRKWLDEVWVRVQVGPSEATRMKTAASLVNRPEVGGE